MTDTTDLREQVADAIYYALPGNDWYENASAFEVADAALAVAEPIIRADERRKVLRELLDESGDEAYLQTGETLAHWLRFMLGGDE